MNTAEIFMPGAILGVGLPSPRIAPSRLDYLSREVGLRNLEHSGIYSALSRACRTGTEEAIGALQKLVRPPKPLGSLQTTVGPSTTFLNNVLNRGWLDRLCCCGCCARESSIKALVQLISRRNFLDTLLSGPCSPRFLSKFDRTSSPPINSEYDLVKSATSVATQGKLDFG
jgi:hypothetical protein